MNNIPRQDKIPLREQLLLTLYLRSMCNNTALYRFFQFQAPILLLNTRQVRDFCIQAEYQYQFAKNLPNDYRIRQQI